jgi:hypothetical protein
LLVSKGWIQAVALVVLFGFLVMGLLAYRTYQAEPPIPVRVVDDRGGVAFTGDDVRAGQHVLLRNGLMQYGSQGQQLWPKEVDHELRVIRYRAKGPVCNACPIKSECTDADDGRELTVTLDPWPHSEAGRFHRGIALVLVVLAATFIVIEAARHHAAGDLTALAAVAAAVAGTGRWALRAFRASPANFPEAGDAPGLAPRPAVGRRNSGGPGWATWTTARSARVGRWDRTRSHRQGP